ncbi:hypothetical protein D3C71_77800 [compost metagenome]
MRRHLPKAALEAIQIADLQAAAAQGAAPAGDPAAITPTPETNPENQTDPALATSADLPEFHDELPDYTAELDDAADFNEQIADAGDVTDSLLEIKETLTDETSGEITEATLKIAEIATEHLFASVGYTHPRVALEDGEEDKEPKDVKTGAKNLVEKITTGAKAIWEKIIKAIEKARTWLTEFFRKLIDFSGHLQKRAHAYEKEMDMREGAPKEKIFENAGLALALQYKGHAPKDLAKLANETNAILSNQLKRIDLQSTDAKKMAEVLVNTPEKFEYSVKQRRAASGLPHTSKLSGSWGMDTDIAHSDAILGGSLIVEEIGSSLGNAIYRGMSGKSHEDSKRVGKSAILEMVQTPRLEHAVTGELAYVKSVKSPVFDVLPLTDLKRLSQEVADMAGSVQKFRGTVTKLENLCSDLVKECKKMLNENGTPKLDGKDQDNKHEAARAFFTAAPRMFIQEPTKFANELLRIGKALLKYTELAAKQYPRRENAPEKEPFNNDPKDPFNTNVALGAPAAA